MSGLIFGTMLSAASVFTAPPDALEASLSLRVGASRPAAIAVTCAGSKQPTRIELQPQPQTDEFEYLCYADRRAREKTTPKRTYADAAVRIGGEKGWFGFTYYLLPWFDKSAGLYPHEAVAELMPAWQRAFPAYPARTFTFDFRYDAAADRVLAYLDGNYAGRSPRPGKLTRLEVSAPSNATVSVAWRNASSVDERHAVLPRPFFAGGRNFAVAPPSGESDADDSGCVLPESVWSTPVDTSELGLTTPCRDLFTYGPCQRSAFATGPGYCQWSVPRRFWHRAYVLCALGGRSFDSARSVQDDLVGATLTRFGPGSRAAEARSSVSLRAAIADGRAVPVKSVTLPDGTPTKLYRLRLDLRPGDILPLIDDDAVWQRFKAGAPRRLPRSLENVGDYLDFELTGSGLWRAPGMPISKVWVYGVTLEAAPVALAVEEEHPGNVFADDETPVTHLRLTATRDATAGEVEYEIQDDVFRPLRRGAVPYRLAKRGDSTRLDFPLAMPDPGWYRLVFTVKADGEKLYDHEAAFALLGRDDREAGFESPFAVWPQTGSWDPDPKSPWQKANGGFPAIGRHLTDPERTNVLELIRKAGFHKGWHTPVKDEAEFPDLKFTFSAMHAYGNMSRKVRTAAEVSNRIDLAVAAYREIRRYFPHCDMIQVCHEGNRSQRGLALELYGLREVEPVEYRGAKGELAVFYATEYIKRMRKEFPDCRLVFGNVGASSDRVAKYARNGFDLNLVDALGSEVRGFRSIPELPADLEAPGTLWALRETGRIYGMTNAAVEASGEYVFRPERRIAPENPEPDFQTGNAVRDYLVSLAFGARNISSGHLQDCFDGYYDTDWGDSGLCRAHPLAYPKRMYVAIATLTKALDRAENPQRIPTGANTVYALGFRRARREPDFVTAFWTAEYGAKLSVSYPRGTRLTRIGAFGKRTESTAGAEPLELELSPLPFYLVSSAPVSSATWRGPLPAASQKGIGFETLAAIATDTVELASCPTDITCASRRMGKFALAACSETNGVEAVLDATVPAPPALVGEYGYLALKTPLTIRRGAEGWRRLGLRVRGNGSFARMMFVFRTADGSPRVVPVGRRGYVSFDGWQTMELPLDGIKAPLYDPDSDAQSWLAERQDAFTGAIPKGDTLTLVGIVFGTARQAPDPVTMRSVSAPIAVGDILGSRAPTYFDADAAQTEATMETFLGPWL